MVGGLYSEESLGKELRTLAINLKVDKHVHFLGYQSEVNQAYNGFDVFTLTSFSEGCSNVIQEAMFASLPIIATNVGGNPELVQDGITGILVKSDDHREWSEAVLKLKRDPELLKRMGKYAREYALANFSVKTMVSSYEKVYLDVLGRKGRNNEPKNK